MKSKAHIKTSVELEAKKLELAQKLGGTSTIKELLDKALDAYISQARRHSMADLLGTRFFEGDPKRMRQDRGRTRR